MDAVENARVQGVAVTNGKPPRYINCAFDSCIESNQVSAFPASLEMLWVPGMVVAVLVHLPVLSTAGFAVPLGLLSFDPAVVSRAEAYVCERVRILPPGSKSHEE